MKSPGRNKRWWLWLPLLGTAGWLALFGDKSPSASALAVSAPARSVGTPEDTAPARTERHITPEIRGGGAPVLVPRELLIPIRSKDSDARDLFAVRSWTPPPTAAAQEAPVAPPLPFTFLGKKLEGEIWEIYLARGDQTFIVKTGTTIDGTYRVDHIEPPELIMTYLPLGTSQTLAIGASQ
jgi:hypothetical protein